LAFAIEFHSAEFISPFHYFDYHAPDISIISLAPFSFASTFIAPFRRIDTIFNIFFLFHFHFRLIIAFSSLSDIFSSSLSSSSSFHFFQLSLRHFEAASFHFDIFTFHTHITPLAQLAEAERRFHCPHY
jgi:hypothetical protein